LLEIDIPGFGAVCLAHLVSDYNGTLAVDGRLLPEVKDRLLNLAEFVKIHVVTADTCGLVRQEMEGMPCLIHILMGENQDAQKEAYVEKLGPEQVAAFGNGKNDRRMLETARLGIAVTEGEGCAVEAILAADIHVRSAAEGLDLLLHTQRCKATLRL